MTTCAPNSHRIAPDISRRQQAREAFAGLTRAELSDHLVELGLHKSGKVEDLIERLVNADIE
jgi:hypothetical protein